MSVTVAPSFDDLIAQGMAEALAVRPGLAFTDGDISEAQMHGAGAMADAAIRNTAQRFKETFFDGAEGDALTALVDDRCNIQRDPATPSQAVVAFTRTSAGAAGTIFAGSVFASAIDSAGNSVQFTLDADVPIAAGSNGPFAGSLTSTISGRDANVAAGAITQKITTLFDATFSVTNASTAGGGNDEESDPDLRVRARAFFRTLRRGTIAALEFGAKEVPAVRIAKAFEDDETGLVTVVVSDADGNSTAQMISDARAELENWRAAGPILTVIGGTSLVVNFAGTITVIDGVDPLVLAPLCQDAITAKMKKLRPGETFTLDMAKAAGINVDPDAIEKLTPTDPTADVTPLSYQVVRPGTVSITGA